MPCACQQAPICLVRAAFCSLPCVRFEQRVQAANIRAHARRRSTPPAPNSRPRWLAPEVLEGEQATLASDVYSFGVVLWVSLPAPVAHLPQGRAV